MNLVSFGDYLKLGEQLKLMDIVGEEKIMGVIIGPSRNGAIPNQIMPKLVNMIGNNILLPNKVETLWGGGDPYNPQNVSAIKKSLLDKGYIKYSGAIQRQNYVTNIPKFEHIKIGYSLSMSKNSKNEETFGGWGIKVENVLKLAKEYHGKCVSNEFLPIMQEKQPVAGYFKN